MSNPFSDTELCVKCGLCLPHCPTYGKTLDESESPRGRLSLIQAWAAGQLEASPKLLGHIDNCLLCRSCESACPANVPYGQLVDNFRVATADKMVKPLVDRIKFKAVDITLQSPKLQRWSGSMRELLSKTGVLQVMGLDELSSGLPQPFKHGQWLGYHAAKEKENAKVALFTGCTAELADAETVTSAIHLLTRLGVSVTVPPEQVCCGGMALHNGDRNGFEGLRNQNQRTFDTSAFDAILTLASGCGAVLKEYDNSGFATQIIDISRFLGELIWPDNVHLEALSAKVIVHTPCSLKNVMKSEIHPVALLRRIPDLEVDLLANVPNCCGAAGIYLLNHTDMAQALREDMLVNIKASASEYVVTSNVGCAMHLRAGLKQSGFGHIQVLHPLVLVARQLRMF
jgi:glycolate oxidase iron-sulfur subunit